MATKDRAPSFQFYPRDFMSDPDVQALSWDQRGRYVWALCCSHMSECPGVATESQWRQWMGYTAAQWNRNKDAMRRCFRVECDKWVQERMLKEREEQRARYEQAVKAGSKGGKKRWGAYRSAMGDPIETL